ncbi:MULTISPECIES: DUF6783 domain-containing protein [Blautia]|nr:DUF6783 domain-containing protein [Blautia faecis]
MQIAGMIFQTRSSKIMLKAWKVYRSGKQISFGEALHRAC